MSSGRLFRVSQPSLAGSLRVSNLRVILHLSSLSASSTAIFVIETVFWLATADFSSAELPSFLLLYNQSVALLCRLVFLDFLRSFRRTSQGWRASCSSASSSLIRSAYSHPRRRLRTSTSPPAFFFPTSGHGNSSPERCTYASLLPEVLPHYFERNKLEKLNEKQSSSARKKNNPLSVCELQ